MRALLPSLLVVILALPLTAAAQDMPQAPDTTPDLWAPDLWAEGFRPLPFHRIAEAAAARYHGRLVGAETRPPHPHERELGAELVYEFRLLTPARNLLVIRMDARDGRFLDVAGHGQIEARRR